MATVQIWASILVEDRNVYSDRNMTSLLKITITKKRFIVKCGKQINYFRNYILCAKIMTAVEFQQRTDSAVDEFEFQ